MITQNENNETTETASVLSFKERKNPGPWDNWSMKMIPIKPSEIEIGYNEKGITILGDDAQRIMPSLGKFLGFPHSFIQTLCPKTQAEVVQEIVNKSKETNYAIVQSQNNELTGIIPGVRTNKILHDADVVNSVAEFVNLGLNREVVVDYKTYGGESTFVFENFGFHKQITPKLGDELEMKIRVTNRHGIHLMTELLITRLVCLNGMTAQQESFSWRQDSFSLTPEMQCVFLATNIVNCVSAFNKIVDHAKQMSEEKIEAGKEEEVLIAYARSMNMPQRFDDNLRIAFREEPEATAWGLQNAFTRLATHGGIPTHNSREIQSAAGNWTLEYDLVNARLPRRIAENVGALIEA